ncbi:MAG: ABC transporter ATP-binding protein [Tenuifilaceae bacterium]|jgi:ABC-type multidrug transport system ATPase subunit|nr:ABC transporter ATP-binding protein [Bacteroidales bacterium]MDI9516736.1 ABC transporter ATP-binding protein [Bacteroidota bacterium]NLH57685.1 ABC transporter ATP-binding protein [Rikenellaceae bacterium]OQC61032.1 MAG: putative ABC transporter ATP-binding protein YbhF [Bacteroidetes bacterium ADurb.Bin008]HNV82046.1 ABC transporter ATP-binding protein [Tenuifilaceae bacterium]
MADKVVIRAEDVGKRYGKLHALRDINLEVNRGEIFGLIGPDGAGKTTLFRLVATLLTPDSGSLTVLGHDVVKQFRTLRKQIGYMPGRFSLYHDLTVEENLNFYATVFGTTVKENYALIADVYSQIEPFRKRLAGKLSGGMKQKLALSCALIHRPALLVLDEPTTGVDAVSRVEFWELLRGLREHGITTVVSTPYMDEAMRCDRVALIQSGQLLSIDTPTAIMEGFTGELYSVQGTENYSLIMALRANPHVHTAHPFGSSVHVTFKTEGYHATLLQYLHEKGIENVTIEPISPGIEDRFLELMEREP